MEPVFGQTTDIVPWMKLVRKVSRNFPGLETEESIEEHRQTVLKFMGKGQALCVRIQETVAGVLLFSRGRNMICCLAVDPEYRRRGVASALLEKALSELDGSREITVSTFREGDEKGTAPRALYRKFGFTEGKLTVEFGYPNQEFILYPKTARDENESPGKTKRTKREILSLFEKYVRKLRITPAWDVKLEFVEDPAWKKTGDFKIDCDDRKAILLINIASPKQENLEEVIVHELMHIKMYPLDQVTESLIVNCFEEDSAASRFAYQQFFTALEQTVEEMAKCFLLEFGDDKEFSYGRCGRTKSFNDLYDGLKNIE